MKSQLLSFVSIVTLISVSVAGCTSREQTARSLAQVTTGGDVGNAGTNGRGPVPQNGDLYSSCVDYYEERADNAEEGREVLGGTAAMVSFFALTPAIGPFVLIPIGGAVVWIVVAGLKPMGSASKMNQLILDAHYVNRNPDKLELVESLHPKMFHRIELLTTRVTGIHRDQNPTGFLDARKKIAKVIDEADGKREFCSGKKALRYSQADEFVKAKLAL